MAIGEFVDPADATAGESGARQFAKVQASPVRQVLEALASLRLTVLLFALSIFLVLVGTLAQADHDVWHVVNHTYFRVWIAKVELQTFVRLYEVFSIQDAAPVGGFFYFPGGKLIGLFLALNLLAAHAIRFTMRATGQKLAVGVAALAAGVLATAAVIASGMDNTVESQLSPRFCEVLWQSLRIGVAVVALGGAYWLSRAYGKIRAAEWWTFVVKVGVVAAIALYLLARPDFRLDPASLRILWQLIKGGFAAGVLLVACVLLFDKRGGVVLLHAGIGLLMFGELITDPVANEASMLLQEGETKNYTYNMKKSELAIIDQSGADVDRVTVIPETYLKDAETSETPISVDQLPFDIRVVDYQHNSSLAPSQPDAENHATRGAGANALSVEVDRAAGAGDRQGNDLPGAYVELVDKQTEESLGVWMVSTWADEWSTIQPFYHAEASWLRQQHDAINAQAVEHDGHTYFVTLRFKREHRDWSVTLNDFTHTVYVGTNTPKNFQSDVTLTDNAQSIDRPFAIKMNNPLRYAGTTLYQAAFDPTTNQATVLQVVKSRSWMIPYVSCMIVGVGMVFHFGVTLGRFMRRRMKDEPAGLASFDWRTPEVLVPVAVALVFAMYAGSKARTPVDRPDELPIHRFGALALVDGGRVKPYDTYARTMLQSLSQRRVVQQDKLKEEDRPACAKDLDDVPAIKWMLDSISGVQGARDYRVFRIDNLDLLATLKQEPRPGSFRYSFNEIMAQQAELQRQTELAQTVPEDELTPFQTRLGMLNNQLLRYQVMETAFASPPLSGDPKQIEGDLRRSTQMVSQLHRLEAPRATPPQTVDGGWLPLFEGELMAVLDRVQDRQPNPATLALSGALIAYRKGDLKAVSDALDELESRYAKHEKQLRSPANAEAVAGMATAEKLDSAKVRFERFFSSFMPFYWSSVLYVIAFVLAAFSWLFLPRLLGRSATAIVVVALLLHTFALVGRVYISGRPPVTNLYSSAVFIGAGAVLLGLIFEAVYRFGVGTAVSSVVGFLTLVVAYNLSLDNDTFTVMRAVLDTQFWLATHVVCISLGYSTTFLAGFLGVCYVLGYRLTGRLDEGQAKHVIRMLYGSLCFAILFSFIGTVLGGLWGDDSWGRFWGWDPKENGALIIVLWNALILHARWGAMIGSRGLAALAIAGNIVTSWSWFGVNELGVGLHSYGGLSSGMSFGATVLHVVLWSHLVLIALAFVPSFGASSRSAASPA